MIISQTPYRVSFAGGGTDLPAFYRQEPGAVLSATIQRHMYVTVHRRFSRQVRVAYSRTETVDRLEDLQHDIVREALRMVGLDEPLEITTIGDVPAGTGMGSSSSLAVGLLNAFYAYAGQVVSAETLGRQACEIEIERLSKPIGRQDQYAAAFGGINVIRFQPDDTVDVEPTPLSGETIGEIERRALLVYTDTQRSADEILSKQSAGAAAKMSALRRMRDLVEPMRDALLRGDIDEFAALLNQGWLLKRSLGFGISQRRIDEWYEAAKRAGAQGGKLLGAGGGGFMLLLAPPERRDSVREALGRPSELPFSIDRRGSRIIFVSD